MKTHRQAEYGDFQTPDELARIVVRNVARSVSNPAAIVEPTCGRGSILKAAVDHFQNALVAHGFDINPQHIALTESRFAAIARPKVTIRQTDFFSFDWRSFFGFLPEPILVVGNPPWVTAAELGSLQSSNLPRKSNFQEHKGFDAVTGKSNFDIAEWMLIHLVECLRGHDAVLAMLMKTATARKLLQHAWKVNLPIVDCQIQNIDAAKYFDVAVDACLFACKISSTRAIRSCKILDLLVPGAPIKLIGYHNGSLLADENAFRELSHLQAPESKQTHFRWRSGIKHDCSKVMELRREPGSLMNGYNQRVDIEETYLYPMLKGSEIAKAGGHAPTRSMIVPQRFTSEPTDGIAQIAPLTWEYLSQYSNEFANRGSSIYKNRPRFSVFGVGPYTFAPWKVAICALYKKLEFVVIGPYSGKPVVFDDTAYLLAFHAEHDARQVAMILNSPLVRRFYEAFIFWDAKRAITVDLLQRLNISAAAHELDIQLEIPDEIRPLHTKRKGTASISSLFPWLQVARRPRPLTPSDHVSS